MGLLFGGYFNTIEIETDHDILFHPNARRSEQEGAQFDSCAGSRKIACDRSIGIAIGLIQPKTGYPMVAALSGGGPTAWLPAGSEHAYTPHPCRPEIKVLHPK